MTKATDPVPEKSGANEISAPNPSTPVTLSMSSLHKNAALGSSSHLKDTHTADNNY